MLQTQKRRHSVHVKLSDMWVPWAKMLMMTLMRIVTRQTP